MKIDPQIKRDLEIKLKEELAEKKKKATVISAYHLSQSDIDDLKKIFPELNKTKIDFEVDPNLIAGYVIKIGSKVVDLSIKGKLVNLKNNLYEIT
ncbi:MAG: F0F1 ATP synthase subunit delta [Microgenomates group bacterium]|nr:F0F1 ATP synthase subunit delta [Microgenomates group bacterium]